MHRSRVVQVAIHECQFEQINHPSYSLDLASSDYYLFRNLKSNLRGARFRDDDELMAATEAWFADQTDRELLFQRHRLSKMKSGSNALK